MSIGSEADLAGLRAAGRVVAAVIAAVRDALEPGMTTAEADAVAQAVLDDRGARSGPRITYGFPGAICLSVNEEVVHGVPGPRVLQPGDLTKIDVTVELNGYLADAAVSACVPPVRRDAVRLARSARRALDAGLDAARAGRPIAAIGAAVSDVARRERRTVFAELGGHGIGRTLHEEPSIPNVPHLARGRLTDGLVITIEPLLGSGGRRLEQRGDGWTIATADGSWAAHAEHTIVVTRGRPIVLT